MVSVSSEYSSG